MELRSSISTATYESQNEPRHFGALRKALKIRGRLGGSADMTEAFPNRPRYMHRRTYQGLRCQYEAAVEQYVVSCGVAASKEIIAWRRHWPQGAP